MKGQNIKKKINLMFKTGWKQDNIISLPRERSWETDWLCETHDELIIDFGGQKRNQIQQYFIILL